MKLVALTRVRIDGDVVEEFVRHTLRFVDEIFIIDNLSPDTTPQILDALKSEGLPVTLLRDDYIEGRRDLVTRYTREIFKRVNPDFVLPLDADEFLKVESRAGLEAALQTVPSGAHALVPWRTYVPVPQEDAAEPRILARLRYRLAEEPWQFYKAFVGRAFIESDAIFIPGGHEVQFPDGKPMPNALLSGVELAHFPVRSPTQIQSKALLGWTACIAAGYDLVPGHDAEDGMAAQWRKLYEKLRSSADWSSATFYSAVQNYFGEKPATDEVVYDPLEPVERRYGATSPIVLQTAIELSRQLAQQHAQLQRENEELRAELQSRGRRDSNPQPTSS